MKAYQRQQQYIHRHCQLVLELATEHVQLAIMYQNHWQVHPHHMTFHNYTRLILPSLNNVLPALGIQKELARSNIMSPGPPSHSSTSHVLPSQAAIIPLGLGRMVVGVVVELLLLRSGNVEMNPGPVGKLTPDDLGCVLEEVLDMSAQWYPLGLQLKVKTGTLDRIYAQFRDPRDQLREILKTWLNTSDNTSWTALTDALRSRSVGAHLLASILKTKYCLVQGTEVDKHMYASESQHVTPPPMSEQQIPTSQPAAHMQEGASSLISDCNPPEASSSLHLITTSPPTQVDTERIRIMDDKFDQLADKIQDGIVEQNIPLQRLKRCITRLPVSIKYQHIAFLKENLKAIINSESMEEIFGVINLYCDFLNYTLLEHIVDKFGNSDTKATMAQYLCELVAFRKTTKLSDFISHWPCAGKVPPDMSKLVTKIEKEMEKDWSNCTLEDVEQFRATLTQKLLLPSFAVLLKDAEEGCISLTWAIPSSVVKLLSKDIHNTKMDWFKEHHIVRLAIDGQNLYSSATFTYSTFLRKLYTSQKLLPTLSSSQLPPKLLPFKLARITKEKVGADMFTKRYLRGDMDDVGSLGTECYKKSPIKFEEVGKLSSSHYQQKLILIEGAPGVGKTTFSWEFCRKWSRNEILQDHSLLLLLPLRDNKLKEAKTLSDLFCHPNSELQHAVVQEVTSNEGQGVAIWLEAWDELDREPREKTSVFLDLIYGRILPHATLFVTSRPWASEYLRERCGRRIFQHMEILTFSKDQIEHYISKAEAESQPSSFAAKFTDYLSSNPVIKAAMYTPVTAKMAANVFSWSQHTESPPPTTMTELLTAFTLKTLVDYLSTHPVYNEQQLTITTFSDLPTDVYKQFQSLCKMAYEGILNRQQLVFSKIHLPTGFAHFGLMQEVPQLYTEGKASYHFIHLTLQEYLAALHISQLPSHDQARQVGQHLHSGHFKTTIRFLAGITKLASLLPDITSCWMESGNTKLNCFHFLFEANDLSVTTRTLGTDEMDVYSHYSWTPLDYYVTGHAISHSNCPWRLNFWSSSIDDDKFALFSQGCAGPWGTGCRGHISHANFMGNDITSKSIQSFVNFPPHVLQDMRVLYLSINKLNGSACDLLAEAAPLMSRLEELWLSNNPIGCGGAVEVIKALCSSEVLLSLSNTGIGDPDCVALCELLKSSHSLQHLHIHQNNLTTESVASIITGLIHNSSLTTLDISNSHFSIANVDTIASILTDQSKCTLAQLWLQDCHISGQGASELAAALCKNSTLKCLNLDQNPIGIEGASSMSDMLQQNTSLEELYLCDDSVKEGVHQLINSLKHNRTLRKLRLLRKYKTETIDHRIHWEWRW